MPIEDIIKGNATYIMWIIHIFVALYIFGDTNVFSYTINKYIPIGTLVASILIYDKMRKDMIVAMNPPVKAEPPHKKKEKPEYGDTTPFNTEFTQ